MSVENRPESEHQEWPDRLDIFEVLAVDPEKCRIVKEVFDDGALCRLDFEIDGVEYMYTRKGNFEGSHKSLGTDIYATYPEKYPEHIYSFENGDWKKL